jgi:hypothetical protein
VHVKDPDDHKSLLGLKQILNNFPGSTEIILVLGVDKKSALRLPFRVEIDENLTTKICDIYGKDCVVVK